MFMQKAMRLAHVRIDVDVLISEDSDIDDLKKLSMADLLDRVYQAGRDMRRTIDPVSGEAPPLIEREKPVAIADTKPLQPVNPAKRKR